jgi:hypothetical protein
MFERLLPTSVFRAHWKGLSFYRDDVIRADVVTRSVLVVAPITVGVGMWWLNGRLLAPTAILAGLALLAGGLVAAFGQLSTLRLRLTERMSDESDGQRTDRDFLDETAAHLLAAAYGAAVTAAVLVAGMNFALDTDGALVGPWAAVATAMASWVVLVFLIAIPRMYEAYAGLNKVRDALNGTHRGRESR